MGWAQKKEEKVKPYGSKSLWQCIHVVIYQAKQLTQKCGAFACIIRRLSWDCGLCHITKYTFFNIDLRNLGEEWQLTVEREVNVQAYSGVLLCNADKHIEVVPSMYTCWNLFFK